MDLSLILVLGALGLLVGSFLNVVILRFQTGKSISTGRSVCFSCGKTLSWYELVPLASFIVQWGRCRGCRTKISWQYPLVEASTAISFVLAYDMAYTAYPSTVALAAFLIVAVLLCLYIVIFVYDLRHKIIPDLFSYGAAAAALAFAAVEYRAFGEISLDKLFAGPLLFLFFFSFWFLSRGKWMGLGDAKLALSMGFFLGISSGVASMMLAFWSGAVVSVLLILVSKAMGRRGLGFKSEVPFGPFMIAGFFLTTFFGVDMQSILSFLTL